MSYSHPEPAQAGRGIHFEELKVENQNPKLNAVFPCLALSCTYYGQERTDKRPENYKSILGKTFMCKTVTALAMQTHFG